MTEFSGREFLVKLGNGAPTVVFTKIGACRAKTFTLNNSPVDVSTDDSAWQKMLADGGIQSIDLSVDGVLTDNAQAKSLEAKAIARDPINLELTAANGAVIEGTFVIENYATQNPHNDAATFSCSLKSSGTMDYTPPS